MRLAGQVTTVALPEVDNLCLHHAIYRAKPGDVLVVKTPTGSEAGYWGELMSLAALERGLQGLVIDGCVRDYTEMVALGFAVFATGLCPAGTGKRTECAGSLGVPLQFGDVRVNTGDAVFGDVNGVVVVPRNQLGLVYRRAKARAAKETKQRVMIARGRKTLELFGR